MACVVSQMLKILTFTVVNQYYEAEVVSEYVIRGNTAVLKCNIPSFVADFVRVEAWVGSDNNEYTYSSDYGNPRDYMLPSHDPCSLPYGPVQLELEPCIKSKIFAFLK